MEKERKCPHCGSFLTDQEKCGCPGAERERRKQDSIRERIGDEAHIRLDKMPGDENFYRNIRASSTTALIQSLAVLMLLAAEMLEASVENVYAKVATVLFTDQEAVENE